MSETKHLAYLDGWRGLSIFLVFAGHFSLIPAIYGKEFYTARAGVEFFFALSGRLMAEILFLKQTPIMLFYWRRVSRIFPGLLWLILVLLFVGDVSAEGISLSDAIVCLTFTANYFPPSDPVGHVWSLCVEEHAYIILSMIAVFSRHRTMDVS